MCYAFCKTHFFPDFIVVEKAVGCKDIIASEDNCTLGLPLFEALLFVSNTLKLYGLANKIKIIAAGEISTAAETMKAIGLGANAVYCDTTDLNNYKNFMNGQGLKRLQNLKQIQAGITANILNNMKLRGFKNINDITISNLLRTEMVNETHLEPGKTKTLSEFSLSGPGSRTISRHRKQEHIA